MNILDWMEMSQGSALETKAEANDREPGLHMEMERVYYVVTFKPAYFELLRQTASHPETASDETEAVTHRMVVALTQGGFGQDVVDDERQVKERFLQYLFFSSDLDIPRTAEVFDKYFEIDQAEEFVDLDENT